MKLESDVNQVVLSNVGATGEFKIRNSAKAFKILSDGLYSNKIRAIIRELSCNAVDSHALVDKQHVPFEVHLPTVLEPWFAVKDFGAGLDGDQVVNIYTTYFESTKTDSNKFIGALGLGSKSPFSYTENFTVTATKDGMQRIYSAYINEEGVPSIAEMSSVPTDEENGVEVKFSVTDKSDYYSFQREARSVFAWFKDKPNIIGVDNFVHETIEYKEMNIVPKVHYRPRPANGSIAVMGNISYPLVNIPDASKHFGELVNLLNCGLVIEFDIGELDFAASRENLSYIPLTYASIKRKLELLNQNLVEHLATQATAIENAWEKAEFLREKFRDSLYRAAAHKYAEDTKFELYDKLSYDGIKTLEFDIESLDARGLKSHAFMRRHGYLTTIKPSTSYVNKGGPTPVVKHTLGVSVTPDAVIVLNDLKTGCLSRARYHYSDTNCTVYCFSHEAKEIDVRKEEYEKIIAELHNPPTVVYASTLRVKEREKALETSGIMEIELKSDNSRRSSTSRYMWSQCCKEFDPDTTYYYVTLSGHKAFKTDSNGNEVEVDIFSIKEKLVNCGVPELANICVLGVRKNGFDQVKGLDNWVWFEDKLKEEVSKISDQHVASLLVAEVFDNYYTPVYTSQKVAKLVGESSLYAKYVKKYGTMARRSGSADKLTSLCALYGKSVTVETVKAELEKVKRDLYKTYPLLPLIGGRRSDTPEENVVVDYIKMVDKTQEKINE